MGAEFKACPGFRSIGSRRCLAHKGQRNASEIVNNAELLLASFDWQTTPIHVSNTTGDPPWYDVWHVNGDIHRLQEPAYIEYDKDERGAGKRLLYQAWCIKSMLHRDDNLPALIAYDSNEEVVYMAWYLWDQLQKEMRF